MVIHDCNCIDMCEIVSHMSQPLRVKAEKATRALSVCLSMCSTLCIMMYIQQHHSAQYVYSSLSRCNDAFKCSMP